MANSVVYFDTSLVIDYMLAYWRGPEGDGIERAIEEMTGRQMKAGNYWERLREQRKYWDMILQHDRRYQLAMRLRSIVRDGFPKSRLVISPFVLLELDEWYAEERFKRVFECVFLVLFSFVAAIIRKVIWVFIVVAVIAILLGLFVPSH